MMFKWVNAVMAYSNSLNGQAMRYLSGCGVGNLSRVAVALLNIEGVIEARCAEHDSLGNCNFQQALGRW